MKSDEYKILLVDDNVKNIEVLANLLSEKGYDVEIALNGPDALTLVASESFDLILLDIMMPEMDGFEVCEKIKEDTDKNEIPIIFLTAKTDTESIQKAFDIGGLDYVNKPFNTKELLARVKTHVELKVSKDKLKILNQFLEERVKERTIELKEANIELEQMNNELINLDKEKTEFLNTISHEIRTPLNGIMGFLDLIKLKFDNEKLLGFIDHIDTSANRLEEFALQALLITELKTKRRTISKNEIVIKNLINLINQEYIDRINKKYLKFNIDLSYESIKLNADEDLVTVCLRNVIDNAIKFIPKHGNILVKVYNDEKFINIEVIDDGNGFSESAMKNLFKLFSAGEIHTDRNSGLGLALVNLIMQAHNGKVEVINNSTKGATVYLKFIKN